MKKNFIQVQTMREILKNMNKKKTQIIYLWGVF